jgi:hypothetical protein
MGQITESLQLSELHPAEEKLILFLRQLKFGTLQRLVVRDGLPAFAEEVEKTVRFDRP